MIFDLVYASPKYRDLSVAEIYEAILAAASYDRMLVWKNPEGQFIGLMTWALIPEALVRPFLDGEYKVKGKDFGNPEGELFVMDFLAPHGNVCQMMKQAQRFFAETYGEGTVIRWKRSKRHTFKTGYVIARKVYDVAA